MEEAVGRGGGSVGFVLWFVFRILDVLHMYT